MKSNTSLFTKLASGEEESALRVGVSQEGSRLQVNLLTPGFGQLR